MIIFPAIDLRDGQVVRLRQGDPSAQTVYGDDPAQVARRWEREGAEWLHVVNLDGAFTGNAIPVNLRRLSEVREATNLPIQFGGGVRSLAGIAQAIELGATRVVLGTAAVREPEMVAEAVQRFGPERIVVGIDAREGRVAIQGWRETSGLAAGELAGQMAKLGILRAVYTDISRDGTLEGASIAASVRLAQTSGLRVIASGGVGSLDDLAALTAHQADGIEGAIVGQALYTGTIDLGRAIQAARGQKE